MKTALKPTNRRTTNGHSNRRRIRFSIDRGHCSLESAVQEVQVLIRARNGWSTEAIANDLGLSKGQVSYRVKQGLATHARKRFRSGETWEAQAALRATAGGIIREVEKSVTVKFL